MASAQINSELSKQIADLKKNSPSLESQDLVEIIRSVIESLGNDAACGPLRVYSEIGELADYIKRAREDISALCPIDITEEHLPTASDELDAIVEATEKATNSIFEAVESIEGIAAELPSEVSDKITEHITSVYEACSFQDITGQRINKVVKALKHIEARIEEIMVAFDARGAAIEKARERAIQRRAAGSEDGRSDAHLMNGPQNEGEAISQDDIDALLGFD